MKLCVDRIGIFNVLIAVVIVGQWGAILHAQSVAPSASSPAIQPGVTGVTDIFIGRNTKGPYLLSWKNVEQGSDVVIRDGFTLSRGTDYNIDYTGGMLAFASSLPTSSIVRITYSYKPEKASANVQGMTIPVSIDLLDRESSRLQVLGLYKEQDPNRPETGQTIFGLGGTTRRDNTEVTTTILTTAQAGDTDEGPLSLWERSGVKLGAKTSAADGRLNLTGSYARAGEQFGAAKEYGLKTGYETYDLGAALRAADGVQASFSLKRTEDVGTLSKGASVESQQHRVVIGTDSTPRLTATRATEERVAASGETARASTTDTLALEHTISPRASVAATRESRLLTNGDTEESIDTTNIAVNLAPAKNVQVTGVRTMVDSETEGGLTATDVTVAAQPIREVTVQARYLGKESETGGEEAMRQIRVETQPLGFMNAKITGAYSDRETSFSLDTTREARLELSPLQGATLGGGFRQSENGDLTTTVTDVAGSYRPSGFLELSGAYKSRETTGAESVDSKAVRVALAPVQRLRLIGSYETNPEDRHGAVQQVESKSLGLETRIGSLTLSGGYALKDEYALGRQSHERRLGMDLPLFQHGRLTTGYKESGAFLDSQEAMTTYSLGYQHNVGSRFTFSLMGHMTQYERDRMALDDQTEYKAETKLGIRF